MQNHNARLTHWVKSSTNDPTIRNNVRVHEPAPLLLAGPKSRGRPGQLMQLDK